MNDDHNKLVAYVLDYPLEIARLRETRILGYVISFLCGVLCALWFF